jgi:hypothetical protein
MGKMHELLAVEKDIVGRANAIIEETLKTFKDKAVEFYTGRVKTYKPFDEADKDLLPVEQKELVDTVPAKLKYTFEKVAEEYDWLLQKEATNQSARADLVVDGVTLGSNLPATFLLTLEHRLEKIRQLILNAPTLPNGLKWTEDSQKGADVFKLAEELITYRTRKISVPFVLSPATDKHPAQVQKEERTETIGSYREMQWDSRVTSHTKSILLERVDKMLVAVRKAVRKANDVEASDATIGKKLFDFVLSGK